MRFLCILVSAILIASGAAYAATYVVNPEGTGDFATIQEAVSAAVDGDIIELTSGTFTGDGNRDVDYLGKAITIRSRDGDPEFCVIDCEGTADEPHRGFHLHNGEGPGSLLEGITVANGYFTAATDSTGGGVMCLYASPTIRRCVFSNNTAFAAGGFGVEGGNATVEECVFVGNVTTAPPTSPEGGAGIGVREDSHVTVRNCRFIGNRAAASAAGMGVARQSSAEVSGCVFEGNTAGRSSGGFGVGYGSSAIVTDCEFIGNHADAYGGVTALGYDVTATFSNCTLVGNSSPMGGAFFTVYVVDATFSACTLYGNSGTSGGAFAIATGDCAINIDNSIIAFGGAGGALYGYPATFTCTDIYGNEGGDWTGAIAGQYGVNGNISEDPLFCDAENGVFTLRNDSPCAPFSPPNVECDLIGAWPVGCWKAPLDIKPRRCPNYLFSRLPCSLPVAVLGTAEFDVRDIDVSTVLLEGAVSPWFHQIRDVATPVIESGDSCACTTEGRDGFEDLNMRFWIPAIMEALGTVSHGEERRITVTGELEDGTPFEAQDCVVVIRWGCGGDCQAEFEAEMAGEPQMMATSRPEGTGGEIRYTLSEPSEVELAVVDVSGRVVRQLGSRHLATGEHTALWDGRDSAGRRLASGVYFYRLHVNGALAGTHRFVVVR